MLPEHEIVCPKDIGLDIEVDENGTTFEENAKIKAKAFAEASGMVTLADDSGLEVDCLNGEPGIFSARYCPKPGADDADRRKYLLENIRKSGAERPWKARFVCEIAVVFPGENRTIMSRGTCEGEIIPEERGTSGFGYDPVFYIVEKVDKNYKMRKIDINEMKEKLDEYDNWEIGRYYRNRINMFLGKRTSLW